MTIMVKEIAKTILTDARDGKPMMVIDRMQRDKVRSKEKTLIYGTN